MKNILELLKKRPHGTTTVDIMPTKLRYLQRHVRGTVAIVLLRRMN